MKEPEIHNVAISVVVAIYNAEKTLRRCLDSLVAQSMSDFEVLLIDDGSADASGGICDEYAGQDARFRAFHKENGGVSSARQMGVDHACGEYTIHVDPDDWVEPDMLELLLECASAQQADVVICDFYYDTPLRSVRKTQAPTALTSDAVMRDILCGRLHGSLCNKLIKRSLYEQYNVRLPIGYNMWEDVYVCNRILRHDVSVAYLKKSLLHYCYNPHGSAAYLTDLDLVDKYQSLAKMLLEGLSAEDYQEEYLRLKVSGVYYAFRSTCQAGKFYSLFSVDEKQMILHYIDEARIFSRWVKRCLSIAVKGNLGLGRFLFSYVRKASSLKYLMARLCK